MLRGHDAELPAGPADTGGIVKALEDDIATYVTRNDLRERVRGFVEDVLLGLLGRDDVSCLVINAHSQGTVLTWDVLCRIPSETWRKTGEAQDVSALAHFVTAGSPIRKYVDIFDWGNQVGELAALTAADGLGLSWSNFWDPDDPVADPLDPDEKWAPGDNPDEYPPTSDGGLLVARDTDQSQLRHVKINDVQVDNIHHSSGGGLQAHDYWNNVKDYIPYLGELLASAPVRAT